jgi:O-antigen ligase
MCGITISIAYLVDSSAIVTAYETRLLVDEHELSTLNSRLEAWLITVHQILDRFPEPIGYYGSQYVLDGSTPHNLILVTLFETGFIGLLSLSVLLGLTIYRLWKAGRCTDERRALGARVMFVAHLAILSNLMFEDAQFSQPYQIYYWVFIGASELLARSMDGRPFPR